MEKVKIKNKFSKNMTIEFSHSKGKTPVAFDENGEAEVESSVAEEIVSTYDNQLEMVSPIKKAKKKGDNDDAGGGAAGGSKPSEEELQQKKDALEAMSEDELKAMATEAKLPKKEWNKLDKDALVAYLLDK